MESTVISPADWLARGILQPHFTSAALRPVTCAFARQIADEHGATWSKFPHRAVFIVTTLREVGHLHL